MPDSTADSTFVEEKPDVLPQFEDENGFEDEINSNPPPPPSSDTPPPLPPSDVEENSSPSPQADAESTADMSEQATAISQELEDMVLGVVAQNDTNSLAGTELEIGAARRFLHSHKLRRAMTSVKNAESSLVELEEDVLYLRRNIAMLHRLLNEKKISEKAVSYKQLKLPTTYTTKDPAVAGP